MDAPAVEDRSSTTRTFAWLDDVIGELLMGMLKLAAGIAVGYVLGTRAGREKYEHIAATARKVGSHPSIVQAQEKVKSFIDPSTAAGGGKGTGSDSAAKAVTAEPGPAVTAAPRQTSPRPTGSGVITDPSL